MPNQPLLKELIRRTKGRLMVMNETGLQYQRKPGITLTSEIQRARNQMSAEDRKAFNASFKNKELYMQYRVKA